MVRVFEASKRQWRPASGDDSAKALRILLAEDTPISAEAMKAMAHRFGVEMDVAENGLDAIDMVVAADAKHRPYSLLMLDVMMPVLDGIETTKRLRERGFDAETLPIIAVTAATSMDEIRTYRAAGMQAFLSKPVALKDMRAALQAWGHQTENNVPSAYPDVLQTLQKQFEERNQLTFDLINNALAGDVIEEDKAREIRHLLHQIAGTATTFGDKKLSEAARAHENGLIPLPSKQSKLRKVLEQAAASLTERLNK